MSAIRFGHRTQAVPVLKAASVSALTSNQRPENAQQLCMQLRQHLLSRHIPMDSLLQVVCVPGTLANEGRYILQVDCDFRVGEQVKQVLCPSYNPEQPLPTFEGWPVRIQYKVRNRSEVSDGTAPIL